jgi:hypothetical protein
MSADKDRMRKSAAVLSANAEEASHLAKAQRKTADEQHVTAHKLERLSSKLAKGAADLKEDSKLRSK